MPPLDKLFMGLIAGLMVALIFSLVSAAIIGIITHAVEGEWGIAAWGTVTVLVGISTTIIFWIKGDN